MKTTNYLIILLTVSVLAVAGCSKSDKPNPNARVPGRLVLDQLQEQFPNPSPEVVTSINKIRFASRYRTFDAAQAELDKLAQLPNLTEAQTKAIDEVKAQVKAAIDAGQARPTQ
jgi:hypothetical protein